MHTRLVLRSKPLSPSAMPPAAAGALASSARCADSCRAILVSSVVACMRARARVAGDDAPCPDSRAAARTRPAPLLLVSRAADPSRTRRPAKPRRRRQRGDFRVVCTCPGSAARRPYVRACGCAASAAEMRDLQHAAWLGSRGRCGVLSSVLETSPNHVGTRICSS